MAGRCDSDTLLQTVGRSKIEKGTKLTFNILRDLDTCHCVRTSGYVVPDVDETENQRFIYNRFDVPPDAFSCKEDKCTNTGTLANVAGQTGYGPLDFPVRYDAEEFYAGILTMYMKAEAAGTYRVRVQISSVSEVDADPAERNADVYEVPITFEHAGHKPIVIDLAQAPSSVLGTGWEASTRGAIVTITVPALTASQVIGFSSICMHDTIEDFEINDTVIATCITDITNDITADPVDASCFSSGYDPNSMAVDFSATVGLMTGNYHKLNPFERKGQKTEGFKIAVDEKEVERFEFEGKVYGYVQFPDMFHEECGFKNASISDSCNVSDSDLTLVNSPQPMNLTERQFQVLDGTYAEGLDAGVVLVHESLIGQSIIVAYPKAVSIEEFIADDKDLNKRRTRMAVEECLNDGTINIYVFENVLVTTFPLGRTSTDEQTWELAMTIQRGKDGAFYKRGRITNE